MATINKVHISIRDLSEECIESHGLEVLESVINHRLLEQSLANQKITIDQRDLNEEVAQAAMSMNKVTKDGKPDVQAWLATVTKQTCVGRYVRGTIGLAIGQCIKKLVGNVEVAPEDISKGFDANYGRAEQKCPRS